MEVISLILAIIFIFLSGLHLYWALFGLKDPASVLPADTNGSLKMRPGKLGTILVALFLSFFASIYLNKVLNFIHLDGLQYISTGIGIVFLLRSIGDFKYVGFFKSIKGTRFSTMDQRYYAPLALVVSLLILALELWG